MKPSFILPSSFSNRLTARAGFAMNRSHVQPNEIKAEAAKTIKEACELAEAGFRYVTEMEGAKIFGKRKLGVKRK